MKVLTIFFILLLALACKAQNKNENNQSLSLKESIDSFGADKDKISVIIDKSDYRLYVIESGQILKEYPVVFGRKDNTDKLMQGDKCTPEGMFKIISKYPHKE